MYFPCLFSTPLSFAGGLESDPYRPLSNVSSCGAVGEFTAHSSSSSAIIIATSGAGARRGIAPCRSADRGCLCCAWRLAAANTTRASDDASMFSKPCPRARFIPLVATTTTRECVRTAGAEKAHHQPVLFLGQRPLLIIAAPLTTQPFATFGPGAEARPPVPHSTTGSSRGCCGRAASLSTFRPKT